jgi:aconitate hydratase
MLAAGLLAKKAVEKGLKVSPRVKTSLAPGSRVVTDYLKNAGLMGYLNELGFYLVGYGCSTCAGFSGALATNVEEAINAHSVIAAGVLSGNRNFEGRIHPSIKANFLMSPPLVVAFALAGTVLVNVDEDPLGAGKDGKPVYLRDIWPSDEEIGEAMREVTDPAAYRRLYGDFAADNPGVPLWDALPSSSSPVYEWDGDSTYFKELPFYRDFTMEPGKPGNVHGARALGIYGDSITTDHINPVGAIPASTPAGRYLLEKGVQVADFNTYSSRRCNHEVQMRSIFANVRVRNLMAPGTEGSITVHQPGGERLSVYDAAMRYIGENVPAMVFAGEEYGTGSSRDWAAKGLQLLGVRAVIANSFERIHRRNLAGMGVLPCQFKNGASVRSLALDGTEVFDLLGLDSEIQPQQDVTLVVRRSNGRSERVPLSLRLETAVEVAYFRHGGILPYVLRQILAAT